MMDLKLRGKLGGSFAALIVALAALGAIGFVALGRMNASLAESAVRMERARTVQSATAVVNVNLRSRIEWMQTSDSTRRTAMLVEQGRQSKQISGLFALLDSTTATGAVDEEERGHLDDVRRARADYLDAFAVTRQRLLKGQHAAANAYFVDSVLPRAGAYLAMWDSLAAHQQQRVGESLTRNGALYAASRRLIVLVLLGAVLAAAWLAWRVTRSITEPVRGIEAAAQRIAAGDLTAAVEHRSADELGSLADAFRRMTGSLRDALAAIDASAASVASTAGELAASAEEVTASAETVSQAAQSLAQGATEQTQAVVGVAEAATRSAGHASQVAGQAEEVERATRAMTQVAAQGQQAAADAMQSMSDISGASRETVPLVAALSGKADEVSGLALTISRIAAQTHLLALNASIEAARAGEHGRGFAVVADEIKKLADGSRAALEGIHRLVREMQGSVADATDRVQRVQASVTRGEAVIQAAASALAGIADQVTASQPVLLRIVELSTQQRTHVEQLAEMAESISRTAQANAGIAQEVSAVVEEQTASMEQVTQSSQQLAGVAADLQAVTARFVVE